MCSADRLGNSVWGWIVLFWFFSLRNKKTEVFCMKKIRSMSEGEFLKLFFHFLNSIMLM